MELFYLISGIILIIISFIEVNSKKAITFNRFREVEILISSKKNVMEFRKQLFALAND